MTDVARWTDLMSEPIASAAGTVTVGDLTVNRMGFGAMRITGDGVWGPPADRTSAGASCVVRWSSASTSSTPRTPTDRT